MQPARRSPSTRRACPATVGLPGKAPAPCAATAAHRERVVESPSRARASTRHVPSAGRRPLRVPLRSPSSARHAENWTLTRWFMRSSPSVQHRFVHQDSSALLSSTRRKRGKRFRSTGGRGSVGRASPCQGEGREFESRRPLGDVSPTPDGGGPPSVVEWPRGEATDCKSVYTGSNPVSTSGGWRSGSALP